MKEVKDIKSKCDMILHALVGPNQIKEWWNSPNKAFDMKTAKEQFDIDPKVVYNYLMGHASR